jgi:hypothetical protein
METRDYRAEECARIAAIDELPDFRLPGEKRCHRPECKSAYGKGPRLVGTGYQVYCKHCDDRVVVHCPTKVELGQVKGRPRTRPDLPPGMRERICELDGARCWLCGRDTSIPGLTFDVAHIGGAADLLAQGATDAEINSEHNLFWCCAPCNQDRRPVDGTMHPKFILRLIRARLSRNGK